MNVSPNPYGLLAVSDDMLDTGKIYHHAFQGYQISSKNEQLFVYHKKEIKLIALKDIGSTMGVFYLKDKGKRIQDKGSEATWEVAKVLAASQLFEARDEEKGSSYFFLPYFPVKEVAEKNTLFEKLGIDMKLEQSEKWIIAKGARGASIDEIQSINDILSFLFGLIVFHGKFEAKGTQLNSIKIHLPLFWQYLQIEEKIEHFLQILQAEGIFLQTSKNQQQGKISYQITSNDWEVLQIFADWYKPVENFTQITKKEQTAQAIQLLKEFVAQGNIENAEEVKTLLEKWTVKILVK